jgi:uncharacterized protein (UPF0332 family)
VNDSIEPYHSKALEALAGARSELEHGRFNNAAGRAYYAAYDAAIVALIRAGASSRNDLWGHDEVQARFARELTNRRKLYPAASARVLYDLRETRERGDYGTQAVGARKAQTAVSTAERFVRQVLGLA